MRKVITLLLMLSLFATGKMSAGWGYATCILPDKSQRTIEFRYEITSTSLNRIRIISATDDNKKSCVETNRNQEVIDQVGPYFEGCEIIFPSNDAGWTITSVGEHAFYHCKAKVILPESVTEIEDEAFLGYAYDGYDFALPSKVRYIGKHAFSTSEIKGISLPSSLQNIDDYAFSSSSLEELVLPKSTFVVGNGITLACNKLQRLEVESGCKNYSTPAGSNVIMDTKQKAIVAGCPTSKIPAETYRIGSHAFYEIKFVNETVTIPENVGVIAEHAFYWAQFKRLIIKGETVEIGECAFCRSTMERIDIYGGNVTIGESGFEGCGHLLSLWCHSHKPTLTPYKMMSEEGFWEFSSPANRQFAYIGSNAVLYAKYPEEYTDKWDDGTLIWQGWFKEVLPLPDEEKTISEIHITDFNWPVATQEADYTATLLTKGLTLDEIAYRRKFADNESYTWVSPTVFEDADRAYNYSIAFSVYLNEGYSFADKVDLYVDGQKTSNCYGIRIGDVDGLRFFFDGYRVPAPPGGVPINSVSLSVAEPVAGQPLSTVVTNPTGKKYDAMKWTYSMVTWGKEADASLDSYDPTKAYTLAALVTAKEDYCFGADCTFTLNGKEASIFRSHNTEGREVVMLAVAYGKEEPVVPDTIVITHADLSITMPVKGETPTVEVIRPTAEALQTLGYKISYAEWIEAGKPWESFEAATEPYDPSQTYHLVVVLTADEGNLFAENMEALINDATPQVYLGTNNIGRNTATLVWEYSVHKRGDVNRDGSVNTADVVAVYTYIEKGAESGINRDDANVNGDDNVNTADVVAIYDIIIKGSTE
ncbi:MAG: leucine-rich repeat protein [Bacteroidaceae bacterium]|nr:leucine-rich repeat protein [Bacteroidaceae bacterium]